MRPGNTASFEEMLQRLRAVGNTVSYLNLRSPTPETNAFPLDQLAVFAAKLKSLYQLGEIGRRQQTRTKKGLWFLMQQSMQTGEERKCLQHRRVVVIWNKKGSLELVTLGYTSSR